MLSLYKSYSSTVVSYGVRPSSMIPNTLSTYSHTYNAYKHRHHHHLRYRYLLSLQSRHSSYYLISYPISSHHASKSSTLRKVNDAVSRLRMIDSHPQAKLFSPPLVLPFPLSSRGNDASAVEKRGIETYAPVHGKKSFIHFGSHGAPVQKPRLLLDVKRGGVCPLRLRCAVTSD